MDANRTTYELKSDLARLSLPSSSHDENLKLPWVNSVCLLFLLIGIVGARRGVIAIKSLPPIRQVVPVVVMPQTLPPPTAPSQKKEQPQNQRQPTQVYVALPNSPNVNFSVPSIGTIASAGLASAPPLNPLQPRQGIASVGNTGAGGDRSQPPYPQLAMQSDEQGTLVLLLGADASGHVVSVEVKQSSGFPFLDHATIEFVKSHWRLPVIAGTQHFQTSITYKLQF
jgi:protein TonB